ncbi:hypothetical protein ONZ51_g7283 [Trametes cubensis]|uniref:Uncharacterized protein n=1 Tax=Trametes cubensis TaxID=1111947 RepID=A0AAD7XAB8_9APHY|nr:hypothetical protein ONZ51_g7283 [Trametes cubensis]
MLVRRCGIVNGFISRAFRRMPELHAVHLILSHHGIPWLALQLILALPQLREFSCTPQISYTPEGSARVRKLVMDSPAPLTSFQFTRDIYAISHLFDRLQSRAEERLLDLILRSAHTSLTILALPIESAPLRTIGSLDFPRLRELTLKGLSGPSQELQCDLVSALGRMPELRVLELDIALSPRRTPQPIWPPGVITTYPWPHLQRLCVSFPHANDQLYPHLPGDLTHLALRYSPHQIIHKWEAPWRETECVFPPSSADDILRILQECKATGLVELEVEYHQGEDDDDTLLRYIATSFPELETLRLFLYHRDGAIASDVNGETADALARTLGSSVTVVKMLRPQKYFEREYEWGVYEVVRDDAESAGPYARYSYFLTHGEEEPEDDDANDE